MRFAITNATGQCVVVETEQSIHEEPHVDTVMHDFFDRPRADIVQFERPGELIVYTDTTYSRTYYNEMYRDIVLPQDEIPIITWYEQCNTGMLLVRNGHLDREQFLEALRTNNAVVIGDARKMVRIDVVWWARRPVPVFRVVTTDDENEETEMDISDRAGLFNYIEDLF